MKGGGERENDRDAKGGGGEGKPLQGTSWVSREERKRKTEES